MAKKTAARPRRRAPSSRETAADQLRIALSHLIQTQALHQREFAHIMAALEEHTAILNQHSAILRALPDAVREKIGFVREADLRERYNHPSYN